jgi:hypothetical protein
VDLHIRRRRLKSFAPIAAFQSISLLRLAAAKRNSSPVSTCKFEFLSFGSDFIARSYMLAAAVNGCSAGLRGTVATRKLLSSLPTVK